MQRGFTPSTKRIVGRPGTGLGLATAYCSGLGSIENCNSEQRFSSDKTCFWEDIEGYECGDRITEKRSMLQTFDSFEKEGSYLTLYKSDE